MVDPDKTSFGGKIDLELKNKIDAQLVQTKIPIGVAVEALAELWEQMSDEEQKFLCYGTNQMTFLEFIDKRIRDFLCSSDGVLVVADAIANSGKDQKQKKRRHPAKNA